ncbi:MAG: fumarate hydratase [Bacillus subtilis]|nr:fumarate hydratase [Bacillus subtilis]
MKQAIRKETKQLSAQILSEIIDNQEIARNERIPMCQDTGVAALLRRIGESSLSRLRFRPTRSTKRPRLGYQEGLFAQIDRSSSASTAINTARQHARRHPHQTSSRFDTLVIRFAPKGAGSENMSRIENDDPRRRHRKNRQVSFVKETIVLGRRKSLPAAYRWRRHRRKLRTRGRFSPRKRFLRELDDAADPSRRSRPRNTPLRRTSTRSKSARWDSAA